MTNSPDPAAISGLSEIADDYRFILCDVWGVLHDGLHAYSAAVDALVRFRTAGGRVILITNAPRPGPKVVEQLDRLGVARAAFDDIVTSGDVARSFLSARAGAKLYHLGPERDRPIYAGLANPLVDENSATLISCTGLFDDTVETPDDYAERLERLANRGLPMLCVNPDRVVERGNQLVWCAGALAERYAALGGETIIVGKPFAHIYDTALGRLASLAEGDVARQSVLAIGDGAATDLRGAFDQNIDILFVTNGIHAAELGPRDKPDPALVREFLAAAGLGARNFISRLSW
jgi:HAD superfamily hydrolase (TIGR01459 family)